MRAALAGSATPAFVAAAARGGASAERTDTDTATAATASKAMSPPPIMRMPGARAVRSWLVRDTLAPVAAENAGGRSDAIVSAKGRGPSGRAEWREMRSMRRASAAMSGCASGASYLASSPIEAGLRAGSFDRHRSITSASTCGASDRDSAIRGVGPVAMSAPSASAVSAWNGGRPETSS